MDFYGIWGPSRDAPVEHYVECSSPSERLSLTLRYVTSQPPSADSVQQVMRSDQQAGSRALRASKRARLHDVRGRFRYVPGGFLSSLAVTSLQMGITRALISENAKQGAPLQPPEPLASISSDFAQYP